MLEQAKGRSAEQAEQQTSDFTVLKFGIPKLPYPARAEGKVGNPNTMFGMNELVSLEKEPPLTLITRHKDPLRVLGMLYRNIPAYSQLEIHLEALQIFHPQSKRILAARIGDKGTGKTHDILNICYAVHPKGAVITEMGGRHFKELFEKVGIDTNRSSVFTEKLIEAERTGTLQSATSAAVDAEYQKFREGLDEEKRKSFTENPVSVHEKIDALLAYHSGHSVKDLSERISLIQGWNYSSSGLNFTSRPGDIWQAIVERRPLLIDEFDKAEKGTVAEINTFWQLLVAPETISEYRVDFNHGETRIIRRTEDPAASPGPFWDAGLKANIYYITPTTRILMAGNYASDGAASNDMPDSAYDRIKPKLVPNPTQADFSCIWSQKILGMNIPILYEMDRKRWDKDPDAFFARLELWRNLGLTIDEQHQIHMERPWVLAAIKAEKIKDTLTGLHKLGRAIFMRREILDEDSDTREQNNDNMNNLSSEGVNAMFAKKYPQTYRTVDYIYSRATGLMPRLTDIGSSEGFGALDENEILKMITGDMTDVQHAMDRKDIGAELGTRIVEIIESDRAAMTRNKPVLAGVLQKIDKDDCGIFPDALGQDGNSIPHLINFDPAAMYRISPEARIIQEAILSEVTHLIGVDSMGQRIISNEADAFVPIKPVQEGIAITRSEVESLEAKNWPAAHERSMILPRLTRDIDLTAFKASPLYRYRAVDTLAATKGAQDRVGQQRPSVEERSQNQQKNSQTMAEVERASIQSIIYGLTLPVIGRFNLKSIWTPAVQGKGLDEESVRTFGSILENTNPFGYAYTCFAVANPELDPVGRQKTRNSTETAALEGLHLIWNRQRPDQFLFIGGLISKSLEQYINSNPNIHYVERARSTDAQSVLAKADQINLVLKDHFDLSADSGDKRQVEILNHFAAAIKARRGNDSSPGTASSMLSAAQMLAQPGVKLAKPLFITANRNQPLIEIG